jgi:nucleoside-diphosphate-sugar epimerase
VIDLAHLLKDMLPVPVEIDLQPARVGDIYRNYSDISKARHLLGFEPRVTLQIGLQETLAWLIEQKVF